jgi:peroxiredoxin
MSLKVGQKAPGFRLPGSEKRMVSLEEFRGRNVILFFYPMAWTSTCTKEMCMLQEDYRQYEGMNAVLVGISVDTIYALKRYSEDYKLDNVILLSDFNKTAIRDYDVVHHDFTNEFRDYIDVAKRATFVIDKEGIIRFIEVLPNLGDFPSMEKIKEVTGSLG